MRQIEAKFKTAVIAGTVGPGIVGHLVYLSSGQLKGLLGGMAGAAEYEYLSKTPGKALAAMDAQSIGHVYFIVLMIISNIVYFDNTIDLSERVAQNYNHKNPSTAKPQEQTKPPAQPVKK